MRRWPATFLLAAGPLMAAAGDDAADYYVRNLPGIPKDAPTIKMHAGHIEITPEHNGNLFFWHFENKHIANRQRTVIWLNGGPGCSSEDGALMEIGPYRVKDKDTLMLNEGSWNEFANLLFVDNPVGTGFSYVNTDSYIHELDTMADQFIQFLDKFFALFPHYERDDIYIAGESYAGQHIPYIARAIIKRNEDKKESELWNLKGLLIGNGWMSPRDQYDTYLDFALAKGLVEKDSEIDKQIQALMRICHTTLSHDPGHVDYPECEDILTKMLLYLKKGDKNDACVNMYDVRLRDSYPSCGMNWPPDLKNVAPYLRRPDVIEALHVNRQRNTGWQECSGSVGSAFTAKKSHPSGDFLPEIIEKVPVLLFSGMEDLICNHMGTEAMVSRMKWKGGQGFELSPGILAPRRDWTFEGEPAGFWQEARNLTYVGFYNASHMVPFDYPRRSRDMLDRFMKVDISSIGGASTDSRIDGEKMPVTAVSGVAKPESTSDTNNQLQQAKWDAYRRSGEIVLFVVIVGAAAWGYFIWRERRKRSSYQPVAGAGRTRFRQKPSNVDLEASAFDERELDDLHAETPTAEKHSLGDDDDDEDDDSDDTDRKGKAPAR